MPIRKNILYSIVGVACLAGYIWLFINYKNTGDHTVDVCIIKHVTGVPCPSCGSTRSVLAILDGNFYNAFVLNPMGILLFIILTISPLWVLYDVLFKKSSFYRFYINLELLFKQKPIALFSILLVSANWIWNIYKEL